MSVEGRKQLEQGGLLDSPLTEGRLGNQLAARVRDGAHALVLSCARSIPYRRQGFWIGQFIAILCVIVGAGVRAAVDPVTRGHIPVVAFYPFVLIASIWGGTFSGLSATFLGAVIADIFWVPANGKVITLTAFVLVCLFGLVLARLLCTMVQLHAEQEERATMLAHEVNHRVNNLLGVVQAVSAQTARNAKSVKDYQASFDGRVSALAAAQHLLTSDGSVGADLKSLLLHIVQPFGADRFVLEGPLVPVPDYLGTSFALLLHELSTNAMKYGALSVTDGAVEILWEHVADDLRLTWRERGGPPVTAPDRTGFGTRLLKSAFAPARGHATLEYHPDGVECVVSLRLVKEPRRALNTRASRAQVGRT